eukprot:SAG31_NODE_6058_length_2189_cov_4.375598_1_plen_444_part_00
MPFHTKMRSTAIIYLLRLADSGTQGSDDKLALVLVAEEARERGAACLDGSVPGYWFRQGSEANSTKWVIHLQGGGWCWDREQRADHQRSCHDRAKKGLGSSLGWNASGMFNPDVSSAGGGLPNAPDNWYCCDGILSANSTANPDFHDWNLAFVGYCDGSSFSGNRNAPVNGLHYRGRANLDAVLDRLLLPRHPPHVSLSDATQVLVSGGSAGGLAVYLHADHIAGRLPSTAIVKALADGGFFLDHATLGGVAYAREMFAHGFISLWNSTSGVNSACVAAHTGKDAWKCMFAQYTLPHITTPLYAVEGLFDPWQLENLVQLSGGPAPGPPPTFPSIQKCSATQLAGLDQFGKDVRGNLSAALHAGGAEASGFAPACIVHCQTIGIRWQYWALWRDGKPYVKLREHFHRWWTAGVAAAPVAIDNSSYAAAIATCRSGSANELCSH